MDPIDIHEAKARLSRLVNQAAMGERFIIAKAGKPLVKVTALEVRAGSRIRRLGFMTGQISVPDDFDRMGSAEIRQILDGSSG